MASLSSLYKTGATMPPKCFPVYSTDAIAPGDMLWWDATNNAVRPASTFTWDTDLATTQVAFHDVFIGIAAGRKLAAESADIPVIFDGEFEFTCAAATFDPGALVGPAKASGNALENQKVASVAAADKATARVTTLYASNTTVVKCFVKGVLIHSGHTAYA